MEFISFGSPVVSRLILVASGTISRDGTGRSLAKDDLIPETLRLCKNGISTKILQNFL